MEGDTVSDVATIVGLVADVVLLILLTVALIALVVVFTQVRKLLKSAQATVDTVQEAAQTISERVIDPATENVDTGRRIGSAVGFLMGMFRSRRRSKDN